MRQFDVLVRCARKEETEQLARIGLEAWLSGIAPLVPENVRREIVSDNPFFPFLKALGSAVLVAEIDGAPVGVGASEHADDTISDIWIAPAFQGRGAGSALVRALEREILERRYHVVLIQVAALNSRALNLYRHLGYGEVWREVRFDPILKVDLEKIGLSKRLFR